MPDQATPVSRPIGYRVPAPEPSAMIDWPADLGTRFIVTVDTEEEFDWSAPFSRSAHATAAVSGLAAGHRYFADREVPLAFLVDYPIVADPRAVDILRDLAGAPGMAIGAQLHPWVNPPFDEAVGPFNSFAGNLAEPLEAAKLDVLTGAIERAFGKRPRAYRAGRYGIGPATLRLLAERGYRLDSSMRAGHDYAGEGGPDFGAIGNDAFRTGPGGALIELPLTTIFTGALRSGGAPLYRRLAMVPRARGLFARSRLLNRVAMTPEGMPLPDALEAARVAIGEGVRVLNFSFHSPSLVPGHTPYVRDAAGFAAFYRWWDAMLALLEARGVRPIGLDALIDAAPLIQTR